MKTRSITISAQKIVTIFILMLVCLAVLTIQARAATRQNREKLPIEAGYAISASIGHDRAEGKLGSNLYLDNSIKEH